MSIPLAPGSGSLAGVVVLDLSRVLAGPYAAQTLADLGATVIKIENPRDPDVSRGFPPYLTHGDEEFSAYYAQYNRGKLGVGLDLAAPGGTETLLDLVRRADILVENFRPGTMDKLGVGYDVLRAANPRLVYVAVSGYGQTGSRSRRPAFDNTAQAAGGMWSMNGYPGQPPVRVGVTIGDLSATLFAVIGTLAALRHAERTGEGQLVDVAQVDSILALTETAVVDYTVRGVEAQPAGNEHAWVRPYELFDCADGQVFFGAYTDKLWRASCELFGSPEVADDPEIDTMRKRFDAEVYARRVKPVVAGWLRDRTKAELEALAGDVIPLTAIKTIGEVVDDPGIAERDMIVEADYGDLGVLRMFGQPIKLSATPATPARVANRFAEHSDAVLTGLAGYDADRIAALRASGALS
ncbi:MULTISPECIES: CaiB/BaiF CoA transferase family protein [unclassified Microbacterium]|uniref:CaiB/BaiF CoA transferase family protein n=1 Tax=unclassified Microbacterium TaxID=2609290 RepID=UPI0006FC8874|nr:MULTISPECIES: CoA transferase [unclassified Microbacterium]KQT75679.1 formyl-CoA transferase [Microbacterium sp. Leaf436]MBD8217881.1 CoA transferase [Microbacterium sp. CFBP 13617]